MTLDELVQKKFILGLQRRIYEKFQSDPELRIIIQRLFEQECLESPRQLDGLQLSWMEGRKSVFRDTFEMLDKIDLLLKQELDDDRDE